MLEVLTELVRTRYALEVGKERETMLDQDFPSNVEIRLTNKAFIHTNLDRLWGWRIKCAYSAQASRLDQGSWFNADTTNYSCLFPRQNFFTTAFRFRRPPDATSSTRRRQRLREQRPQNRRLTTCAGSWRGRGRRSRCFQFLRQAMILHLRFVKTSCVCGRMRPLSGFLKPHYDEAWWLNDWSERSCLPGAIFHEWLPEAIK